MLSAFPTLFTTAAAWFRAVSAAHARARVALFGWHVSWGEWLRSATAYDYLSTSRFRLFFIAARAGRKRIALGSMHKSHRGPAALALPVARCDRPAGGQTQDLEEAA